MRQDVAMLRNLLTRHVLMDATNWYLPLGRVYPVFRRLCVAAVAIGAGSARLSAQSTACSAISGKEVAPIVGAALQMMKTGRLLQVQLWDGTAPSAANLALIRAIAAKAVAKF